MDQWRTHPRNRQFFDGTRIVTRNQLEISAAEQVVWDATWPHYETVEEARKFYSPLEPELLAAFWHLGENPEPQVVFGPYRVDFLFRNEHVAIEVDGRGFHTDWNKQQTRWKYLHDEHDLIIKRFDGRDVYRNPVWVAKSALNHVLWIRDRLHLVAA